jgi:hypothetical protein
MEEDSLAASRQGMHQYIAVWVAALEQQIDRARTQADLDAITHRVLDELPDLLGEP